VPENHNTKGRQKTTNLNPQKITQKPFQYTPTTPQQNNEHPTKIQNPTCKPQQKTQKNKNKTKHNKKKTQKPKKQVSA